MLTAKRTLVKSSPELWAEISDPEALGAHFAAFGEIRITRVTDASLVEWEGERAAGRLALEPSGFGTRVELTAEIAQLEVAVEPPPPAPEPEAVAVVEPEPEPKLGFWARIFGRKAATQGPVPPVAPAPPPPPAAPEPRFEPAMAEEEALAVLTATLDSLGMAHHRPFSR